MDFLCSPHLSLTGDLDWRLKWSVQHALLSDIGLLPREYPGFKFTALLIWETSRSLPRLDFKFFLIPYTKEVLVCYVFDYNAKQKRPVVSRVDLHLLQKVSNGKLDKMQLIKICSKVFPRQTRKEIPLSYNNCKDWVIRISVDHRSFQEFYQRRVCPAWSTASTGVIRTMIRREKKSTHLRNSGL